MTPEDRLREADIDAPEEAQQWSGMRGDWWLDGARWALNRWRSALATEPAPPSLEEAWKKAEAALPEGHWSLGVERTIFREGERTCRALAMGYPRQTNDSLVTDPMNIDAYGPTPTAALLDLARRLHSTGDAKEDGA